MASGHARNGGVHVTGDISGQWGFLAARLDLVEARNLVMPGKDGNEACPQVWHLHALCVW
jgi:hypothetical protein